MSASIGRTVRRAPPRPMWTGGHAGQRSAERGQAVLETAAVIGILLFMVAGFVGLMLQVQLRQEMSSAVELATASTFQAPSSDPASALSDATDTFTGTMRFYGRFLCWPGSSCPGTAPARLPITCVGDYVGVPPPRGAVQNEHDVRCSASVRLVMSSTPVAWGWFYGDPTISESAESAPPPIRQ